MGKVFTPEEIERGHVPIAADFPIAAKHLLDMLEDRFIDHREPETDFDETFNSFLGALVFGSTTKGSATRRSDLDILIAYQADLGASGSVVRGYQPLFKAVEERWHTPIEPIIFHAGDLSDRNHTLDPLFMAHLAAVPVTIWRAGINPVQVTKSVKDDWTEVFKRYALHKHSKFTKALANTSPEVDYKVLQRAFELPAALGRKGLSLMASRGLIEDGDYHSAPKSTVIEHIPDLVDHYTIAPLKELVSDDSQYSDLLDAALTGNTSNTDYADWVQGIYVRAVSAALDFTVNFSSTVLHPRKTFQH